MKVKDIYQKRESVDCKLIEEEERKEKKRSSIRSSIKKNP